MLSVLFATHNRAWLLPAVLEAFCSLEAPRGGWELIIVDNGSTDDTADVVAAFRERLPVKYMAEPESGKSNALNTGLTAVSGDLVLLTDDDVFPHPAWLVEMRAAVEAHPDYAIFGGPVVPRWEVPPPAWIVDWVPAGPVFAITEPSLPEGPTEPGLIFGPNMAIRAEVFRTGNRFDPSIGPKGQRYPMGSETELVSRLCSAGLAAWHTRRAVVEHYIRRSQLERSWVLGRAGRHGQGMYRLSRRDQPTPSPLWFGVPPHLLRTMLRNGIAVGVSWASRNEKERFHAQWQLSYLRGQISEARQMHRRRSRDGGGAATGETVADRAAR